MLRADIWFALLMKFDKIVEQIEFYFQHLN